MMLDEDLNDRGLTGNHSEPTRIPRLLLKTLCPIRCQIREEETDNFVMLMECPQTRGGMAPIAAGSLAEQEADERSMPVASPAA